MRETAASLALLSWLEGTESGAPLDGHWYTANGGKDPPRYHRLVGQLGRRGGKAEQSMQGA